MLLFWRRVKSELTAYGSADIAIYRASLGEKDIWSPAQQLSEDPYRSEQNPLQLLAPDGRRTGAG